MKHVLAAAVAVVALGLLASCGSDDFGLTAETRSGIDANWEEQSTFEQAATCEQLQSPTERLKASEKLQEDLSAETRLAEDLPYTYGGGLPKAEDDPSVSTSGSSSERAHSTGPQPKPEA